MALILVICEESQAITIALRKLGHEAYSNDIQLSSGGHPEWHLQMDCFEAIKYLEKLTGRKIDLIIAHPPCTYLTISANKWYADMPKRKSGVLVGAERRQAREEAIEFFMKIVNLDCKHIAIENPIGVMSSRYRKPNQVIQPWMFGHGETKATCLWLKGLPKLIPTNIVSGREQRLHKLPPTKDRAKLRSKTYEGISIAIAIQWSAYLKSIGID
jgi:site-specific DNA-cytosine methylase